jgi:hypothetical protein
MTDMKRYEPQYDECGNVEMNEDESGDYVLYSEAQAEIDRLKEALYNILSSEGTPTLHMIAEKALAEPKEEEI